MRNPTENIAWAWTPDDARDRGRVLFIPGGGKPIAAARASGLDVVSVGLYQTVAEGEPVLLRSAHLPLRIRTDDAVHARLRSLADELLRVADHDIAQGGSVAPTPLEFPQAPAAARGPLAGATRLAADVSRVAALGQRTVSPYARFDRWRIGVARCPIHEFLNPACRPLVQWLSFDDPYVYAADPFGTARAKLGECDDGLRIFFEYFDYRAPVGEIRSVAWSEADGFGLPRVELREPHHLSYPALVEVAGEITLMPESAQASSLSLYGRDAGGWTPRATLLTGLAAIDANIVQFNGSWWMFVTDGDAEPTHALHVFRSEAPTGPWTPHLANPVLIDPRWGRGAGTPFVHNGRLIRPTQDGTRTYGGAVVLCEVTELSDSRYAQVPLARVTARQLGGGAGLHTLAACGEYTLVDVKDRVLLPGLSVRAFRASLTR